MGTAKGLAKNSFWLMTGTGISILVGTIYRPVIARMLDPDDFGRYTFITTFIGYFTILAYFGLRQVVVREVSRDRENARGYLAAALRIRTVTALAAMAACCAVGFLLSVDANVKSGIAILSVSLAVAGLGEILEGVLLAFGRSYFIALASLTGNLLKLVIGIWALKAGYGLLGVLTVFILTSAVSTVMDWWFVRSLLRTEKRPEAAPELRKTMLRESLPFVVLSAATRLYTKNDILFLTMLRGVKATGLYGAAYTFVDLLMAIANSAVSAVYPVVAKMHTDAAGTLGDTYERLHKYMLLLLLPISVLLMSLGGEVLVAVFGKDYLRGTPALQVLVWTPPVEVSCLISGTFLCAMYRQRLDATIASSMTALNVVATIGLIILFGAMGAAVATVGASMVNAMLHYYYVRRVVGPVKTRNAWLKPMVCCGLMLAAVQVVSQSMPIVRLLTGILVYIAAIAVIRPFDVEDRRLFTSLVKRGGAASG